MTMTREQAITTYVTSLNGDDLTQLLQYMNGCDGCYGEVVYSDMAELNDFLSLKLK